MKIDRITYSRKFNLGQYESEDIGVEVSIEDGEDLVQAEKALQAARKLIIKNSTPYLKKLKASQKGKEGA